MENLSALLLDLVGFPGENQKQVRSSHHSTFKILDGEMSDFYVSAGPIFKAQPRSRGTLSLSVLPPVEDIFPQRVIGPHVGMQEVIGNIPFQSDLLHYAT